MLKLKTFSHKLAQITALLLLLMGSLSLTLVPASVGAASLDAKQQVCDGIDATGTNNCGQNSSSGKATSVNNIFVTVVNIFSVVVGAVSVVMVIIGGFRYVISGGDSNGVSGAKNTILYAIVGLVVVLFAQVIVRFVLTKTKTI